MEGAGAERGNDMVVESGDLWRWSVSEVESLP